MIVKHFAAKFSRLIRFVSEPKRGLANARNAGCRTAKSSISVFTDDDCYPSADYLDAVSLCFSEDPRLGSIGDRVLPWHADDCRVTIQGSLNRVIFAPPSFIPAGMIQGANFACKRAAIEDAGGFDPRFRPGALFNAEEVELLARISSAGVGGRALVGTEGALESEGGENGCGRATHKGGGGVRGKCTIWASPEKQATPPHSWLGEEELAVDKVRRTEHRKLKGARRRDLEG